MLGNICSIIEKLKERATFFKKNSETGKSKFIIVFFQCDYSKELEIKNKKLDDIQVKLHNQIGTLNDTITKLENTNSDAVSNCQALSNENVSLKKVFLYLCYNITCIISY